MNILKASIILIFSMALQASAADYSYIDAGDVYYINDWGSENRRVVVVRKMNDPKVKVRDVSTGETSVVGASSLLTQSELNAEEVGNAITGTAIAIGILGCMMDPDACKK